MVATETVTDEETSLIRTGGTIKANVTHISTFSTDTTSSLGCSLGRGTTEDIQKMPLMQAAHCNWIGKLGHRRVWKQIGCDDLFLEF